MPFGHCTRGAGRVNIKPSRDESSFDHGEPDGSIVVAASTATEVVLEAVQPSGKLDHSFGDAGRVEIQNLQGGTVAVASAETGRILVVQGGPEHWIVSRHYGPRP